MKKYLCYTFLMCLTVSTVAQSKHDKIKTLKVSFISDRISLTPREAEIFWPIYNAYEKNTFEIRHRDLKLIRSEIKQNLKNLTNTQSQEILDKLLDAENKLHLENKKMSLELRKVLSAKKILLLKVAEEEFKRKIFEEFKRKRP